MRIVRFIKRLKREEAKAQRECYDRYSSYLYRICLRYISQRESAEDVLSKVFYVIFTKIGIVEIEDEQKLKAWMRKIAVNECLQELRKRNVFDDVVEFSDDDVSSWEADREILEKDLMTIILDLPIGYRTVFSLFVIEGYTHQEIAEKLRISIGASKSQLSRARAILRVKLEKQEVVL